MCEEKSWRYARTVSGIGRKTEVCFCPFCHGRKRILCVGAHLKSVMIVNSFLKSTRKTIDFGKEFW